MNGLIKDIVEAQSAELKAALCTIVHSKGSTPRKTGAKMIVYENGDVRDTIGGGGLEKQVIQDAIVQLELNKPKLFRHDLLKQYEMCCGGSIDIFIEPIIKKKMLYIFGAGHTGRALAKLASDINFDVSLIDDRQDQLDLVNSEQVTKLKVHYKEALSTLSYGDHCYVVIMTYDHEHDQDILAYCLSQPHAYLGMIGSQRKVIMTKKLFIERQQATADQLSKVDMPIGIEINADSPDEIAISIIAKLIKTKNKVQTK